MRYFLGPHEIAGVFSGLAKGLCDLGVQADLFLYTPHKWKYQYKLNKFNFLFLAIHRLRQKKVVGKCAAPLKHILSLILFFYSLFKYDAYIFSGFGSFFHFYELPLLKLFNKKIIVIFLGSDSRPPYLSGAYLDENNGEINLKEDRIRFKKMLRSVTLTEKFADVIICHTATAQILKRSFTPVLSIGTPIDADRILNIASLSPISKSQQCKNIKIVHAPSRPRSKGSVEIKNAIKELNIELQAADISLDLIELTNRTNEEIITEIAKCDFVVNEVYSDTFMSILDAEAAVLGKPSLKFGYYTEMIVLDNIGAKFPAELLYFKPEQLKDVVRLYASNEELRLKSGEISRKFVINEWSPMNVAKRLDLLVNETRDSVQSKKLIDPNKINYHLGWGLSENLCLQNIELYINHFGVSELHLSDTLMSIILHRLSLAKEKID